MVKETIRTASLYGAPVSKNLVELIERSADELTKQYLEDVKQHSHLPTYRAFDEKELYKRAYRVYSQLGRWISYQAMELHNRVVTFFDRAIYYAACGYEERE